nr:MAG TPA: hypothetical protein [Caudoviricetes sp.]
MAKLKTTAERGRFKQEIHAALYKSKDIKELLLGNIFTLNASKIKEEFREHVKSHLFIDDTITETSSFIYYDIRMPRLEPNIKYCQVILYAICHRDILDNYEKEGYYGNRADILSQMVENCLINDKEIKNSFGIGELSLDSVDIYNATRFYGCVMTFNVPNFR